MRPRADRSNRTAALIVALVLLCWAGCQFSRPRTAGNEMLVEAQTLQGKRASLGDVVAAYEAGFRRRPSRMFAGSFVVGSEWVSDTTLLALTWAEPTDGVYLVVDWDCVWSQEAVDVALGVAEQGGRETILLDPRSANGPKWRAKYSLATRGLRIVTPTDGWWSVGVPDGITPVWFAVAAGGFAAIGVGVDALRAFTFDPAAPRVTVFPDPLEVTR